MLAIYSIFEKLQRETEEKTAQISGKFGIG